jgi:preprotein translocase subunit SecF
MELFHKTHFDFIRMRRISYALSIFLALVGIAGVGIRKGLKLGIDFKGGTSITFEFEKPDTINVAALRAVLAKTDLGEVEIKHLMPDLTIKEDKNKPRKTEILLYIKQQKNYTAQQVVQIVENTIQQNIPESKFIRTQLEAVGPKVGKELRFNAVLAVMLSFLLIMIYVGWRFELIFGVCAIIALIHDVFITLGIFNLLNFELSLKEIAAFLTLVGYSINDTIVIYDRIREDLKLMRSEDLKTIMNHAINSTLGRTFMTSFTVFLAVLSLFLFGGTVIRGFAFVMLVGVIIGSYSTIFVASPLIYDWQLRHGGKNTLRMSKRKKSG